MFDKIMEYSLVPTVGAAQRERAGIKTAPDEVYYRLFVMLEVFECSAIRFRRLIDSVRVCFRRKNGATKLHVFGCTARFCGGAN